MKKLENMQFKVAEHLRSHYGGRDVFIRQVVSTIAVFEKEINEILTDIQKRIDSEKETK